MPPSSYPVLLLTVAVMATGLSNHAASLGKKRHALEREIPEAKEELFADPPALKFNAYQQNYGRKYEQGSQEYWHRRGLFEKRAAEVEAQNAMPARLWEAVAGQFADRTDAERSMMLGYRRELSARGPSFGGSGLSAAASAARELLRPIQGNATLPANHHWMHLRKAKHPLDQGQCGSCWAVTSKAVLDLHYEIYVAGQNGTLRDFSAQQIVSCVPNPRDCGGTGGCQGSTVELAFDWVLHNGLANEQQVAYLAKDLDNKTAKCAQSKALSAPTEKDGALFKDAPHDGTSPSEGGYNFKMHGWQKIQANEELPLIKALYQHGPVAASTAASPWFEYKNGIFDGCPVDVVVDHAVTLIGYGETTGTGSPLTNVVATGHTLGFSNDISLKANVVKYWLIRNSWGSGWGENGFIRMKRTGDGPCGNDKDNYQGTGCEKPSEDGKIKADPKQVKVCGMCGFLWDSVIPLFGDSDSGGKLLQQTFTGNEKMDAAAKLVRKEKSM